MNIKKEVYIIGGPNGAGKTTFVEQFLPKYIHVRNFVNADIIAFGLSPLDVSLMNIKAGKLMLTLIREYKNKGMPFGFETTLAGKKWGSLMKELKNSGYAIYLFFLDISSVKLSISRIKYRVKLGGHSIPEETIRRRYFRSRRNFWNLYKNKADYWYLFNNSGPAPDLVAAAKNGQNTLNVSDQEYYDFFLDSLKEG